MAARDPQIRKDPTTHQLFEPHTVALLSRSRQSLQIIVFSLILGVVLFLSHTGWTLSGSDKPWTFLGPDTAWPMLILAGIALPPALIIPRVMRNSRTSPQQLAVAQRMTGDPLHDAAVLAAGRIQSATIVGCALLEGPAFANTFGLLTSSDLIHLAVTVVLLLGIACWFPTGSRFQAAVERAVENAQLDARFEK